MRKKQNILVNNWRKVFLGVVVAIAVAAIVLGLWAGLSRGAPLTPTVIVNLYLTEIRNSNWHSAYNNYLSSRAKEAFGSYEGFSTFLNGTWPGDVRQVGLKIKNNTQDLGSGEEKIQNGKAVVSGTLYYMGDGNGRQFTTQVAFYLVWEDWWRILSVQMN